ncbi:MAG: D-alanyl-D-alanine carboxypeptidase/D-alanyl-D-alanine-endopeptidase [Candidatus Obscuribacterales bacterium]|nr:D-alanyl-D-alanine carboxypeptidase/D-alanyl-D-alanine-endopeptidase [Steroidobacteraceae bacterium]
MIKHRLSKSFGIVACCCALLWQVTDARDAPPLPPAVARVIQEHRVPTNSVSIFVQDTRSDNVLLALNSEQPRQPASTIKVLTSIAALDQLGPAYTWTTRAYVTGPIRGGVLDGDLVVVGGGDPYLTAERWWSFVTQLRQSGLTAINGDFVIDRSYFAPLTEDRARFDGAPYKSYNVIPDALMVNFQTSTFTIGPDPKAGSNLKLANINIDPLPANLNLNNLVRLGGGNCRRAQQGLRFATPQGASGNAIDIRGAVPRNCGRYSVTRAIMSAPEYAYGTFRTLWEQTGGTLKGKLRIDILPPKARLLHEYPSLTVGEITRLVNKYSNNVMARHLFLTLGAERYGAPATVENGRRAVAQWLSDNNIDMGGFALDNGSGLSRNERITTHGMGQILQAAARSRFAPEFVASLPLAATDGTLRNRFGTAGMQGRVRMKTGTLDDVSNLAGYVNAVSGNQYIVVIFVNHSGSYFGAANEIQSAVLRWVFAQ